MTAQAPFTRSLTSRRPIPHLLFPFPTLTPPSCVRRVIAEPTPLPSPLFLISQSQIPNFVKFPNHHHHNLTSGRRWATLRIPQPPLLPPIPVPSPSAKIAGRKRRLPPSSTPGAGGFSSSIAAISGRRTGRMLLIPLTLSTAIPRRRTARMCSVRTGSIQSRRSIRRRKPESHLLPEPYLRRGRSSTVWNT